MRKMVLHDHRNSSSPASRQEYWESELQTRRVERNGMEGHEFHVRVLTYPERSVLEMDPIPESEKNYLLLPQTGVGVTVQLIDYSPSAKVLLKLYDLALLELYVPRQAGEQIYQDIKLRQSKDDVVVANDLAKRLLETKGDATAYISILMQHYKAHKSKTPSKEETTQHINSDILNNDPLLSNLKNDASTEKITAFADEVDRAYLTAMRGSLGFNHVCDYLVSPEVNLHFYNKLRNEFPYIHEALYSVVSSNSWKEKQNEEDYITGPLHKKQNQILFLFYGLIRARSQLLLRHWAIVEPLGHFYKGHQQPSSKSMGGLFTSCLPVCFEKLDTIYEEEIEDFMSRLEWEPVLTGAFDNYQRMIQKKDQTAHKSAITHIGTAFYAKANVPIHLPKWTAVRSPSGIHFKVLTCSRHESGKNIVTGTIHHADGNSSESEKLLITNGVLLPRIGWDVLWMPGFLPRPSLDYYKQIVPPPRRAWVKIGATNADIAFGADRMLCDSKCEDTESLSSERMHAIHCLARRVVDFGTYSNVLIEKLKDEEVSPKPIELKYMTCIKSAQREIDRARKFETDLVKHINPNVGVVDKMFAFPLSPHCETSHEGMLMAFADMARQYHMIDIDESQIDGMLGRSTLTQTTKKRKINLCVDALSAKMFRSLELNLTKKLTEMGSAEYVEALLDSLKSFTCQHDYLHEHRMHRQDVIWRQFYGCVLQAFQAETRTTRINGDPVKNNLQSHEAFLEICHKALKRHRMSRFLDKYGDSCFDRVEGESVSDMILRWDEMYCEYCSQWDDAEDQPTRLCNNMIKMLDAYFRCVNAVKKQDYWLCEIENILWHGAYKACGKKNYVEEAFHRIDTLYGELMSDYELENFRANRFFLMTALGNAMSLDEVNELLNLWFKKCLIAPTFQKNINHSKHIMTLMKCGYEVFGKKSRRSMRSAQAENIEKLIKLFERTNIYPIDDNTSRDFDKNFFWQQVQIPKASGTNRDKDKESANISDGYKSLYNIMCVSEDVRPDYAEFEEDIGPNDDDATSVMSSVAGREDVATLNDDENSDGEGEGGDTDKKITTSLQRIGNVQRKKQSPLLFKELLGEDGDDAMHGLKEKHLKSLAITKNRISTVRIVNKHFEDKLARRMDLLKTVTEHSLKESYPKCNKAWKSQYRQYMNEKRQKSNS